MPMHDGSGPMDPGPKTGWGRGCCDQGGFNHYKMLTKKGRLEILKEAKTHLEEKLSSVNEGIQEIESSQ